MVTTFHPKLFLFKFDNFLRVVIGTGNLFEEDWKLWNNIFWTKDFIWGKGKTSSFGTELKEYINNVMESSSSLIGTHLDLDLNDYILDIEGISLVKSFPH